MKKYIILLSVVLSAGFITSCNDMLELQNDGRTTMDEVFKTRNGVRGYLNACYNYRPSPGIGRSSLTDDAQDADGIFGNSLYSYWYANGFSAAFFFSIDAQPWASYYEGIRKCNVFLANMANVNTETIVATETEITTWIAQAHALRALYYLQLVKRYGAAPLITEAYGTTHDYSGDRRAPVSEVVTQILADCDAALSAPQVSDGFNWTVRSGQQRGIMTRAAVHAIRSEAVLFAASPLFTDGTYSWADATRVSGEALSGCLTNGYELFRDTPAPDVAQNAYALYFITRPDEQQAYDKETIYGGQTVAVWQNAGMPSTAGQVTAGPCPTQEMVDCYEMQATGEPPITGYADAAHLQPIINAASGYNPAKPYEGRDPRFYASIYYNGAARQLGEAGLGRDDHFPLTLETSGNNISVTPQDDGSYRIETTGGDPNVMTSALSGDLNAPPGAIFIRMEYRAPKTIQNAEFFFGKPNPAGGVETGQILTFAEAADWTAWELDITDWVGQFEWGAAGHKLRFDVGNDGGAVLDVRNMEVVVQTFLAPSAPVETYVGAADGITATDRRTTRTGYYLRKYNNWKSGRDNNADGEVRLFRLAELYLNFAEAAYQSAGPDAVIDLGNGISMSARDAVNAVRTRAGMPPFPAGMTREDFEKKYRNERRVELAFEEHRYFDVRRWKILEQSERYLTGMRITQNGDDFNYERIGFERASGIEKYYFYPLELSEVNKMQDHTGVNWQNPGWN
jgi:hypothetical protein